MNFFKNLKLKKYTFSMKIVTLIIYIEIKLFDLQSNIKNDKVCKYL